MFSPAPSTFLGFLGFFGFKGRVSNFDSGSWLVGSNPAKFTRGSKACVKRSIANNSGASMALTKEIALPTSPARPVRPIRCT
ncbi:Uncharacterised protein [Vibrio cholerae]|nr:Uncharacterised protein [Vibrio cholerae]